MNGFPRWKMLLVLPSVLILGVFRTLRPVISTSCASLILSLQPKADPLLTLAEAGKTHTVQSCWVTLCTAQRSNIRKQLLQAAVGSQKLNGDSLIPGLLCSTTPRGRLVSGT